MNKRKGTSFITPNVPPSPFWDPGSKEPWHMEFEKEEVNDERWTCIVTAAIPSEGQSEECIQDFSLCAKSGLRRAIKIINITDVVNIIKEGNGKKEKDKDDKKKNRNSEKADGVTFRHKLLTLAARYAKFTSFSDCTLPPDLMAAVLKQLILIMKKENILQKKKQKAREKKARKEKIKANFIRSKKPFEVFEEKKRKEGAKEEEEKVPPNVMGLKSYIDDEPIGGPDLYIMLTEFYNPYYFSELVRINVPFVALIKIMGYGKTRRRSRTPTFDKAWPRENEANYHSGPVPDFWSILKQNCLSLDETAKFQHIAMMRFEAPFVKNLQYKEQIYSALFEQLSWTQYSAYYIYRQHQNYLKDMYVQQTVLALDTLNLSRCEVYNKLCDALITGEPNTCCLVLYAIVEQVVVGVPETESVRLEYIPKSYDLYQADSGAVTPAENCSLVKFSEETIRDIPCKICKNKKYLIGKNCIKGEVSQMEKGEWFEGKTTTTTTDDDNLLESKRTSLMSFQAEEHPISEELIFQVLTEKKSEKEIRSNKKWITPKLYLYGDAVSLHTHHCDPRLLDSTSLVDRFWTSTCVPKMWAVCPFPQSEEKAFYNFHLQLLVQMSRDTLETLKLKLYFTLCMKTIGMNQEYIQTENEDLSSLYLPVKEKVKKMSRFSLRHHRGTYARGVSKTFSNYFLKTFIDDLYFRAPRRAAVLMDNYDRTRKSVVGGESIKSLYKFARQMNMNMLLRHGTCYPFCFKYDASSSAAVTHIANQAVELNALLDCFEISDATERLVLKTNEEDTDFIENFYFFEKLEPRRMVQRLVEAHESYNTTHSSCFTPTDALIILMYNDFDHRGVFYMRDYGVLHTPVSLKDFYHYVYPEIGPWLVKEEEEYTNITTKIRQKEKEIQEMKDKKYFSKIKRQFCQMSEEQRQAFLAYEETAPQLETEIAEKDLKNLPKKPKLSPSCSSPASLIATNFTNVRVEVYTHAQEYYSLDGTQVIVRLNFWLYGSTKLLTLEVKQPQLTLLFHKWLGTSETNSNFSLKTESGIIFYFFKNDLNSKEQLESEVKKDFNYFVNISWPTGLLIQGVPYETSGIYVKQSYIKVYRKGWDIRDEQSRCYLKNGQVAIFKETGVVEILSPSGEIHSLYEFEKESETTEEDREKSNHSLLLPWVYKCEWATATGEVWEKIKKDAGKTKKNLIKIQKLYIAVDCKAQEIYYKREDGVACMLRSNGKLVTTFPDGTKITSTPEFDEEEIVTQWSEEEKLFFSKMEFRSREDQVMRSRAILRKPDSHASDIANRSLTQADGFVSVSCTYLMEHPKYSSVFYPRNNPSPVVKMPGKVSIKMDPRGDYEVVQEKKGLNVHDSSVEFYKKCGNCPEKSTGTLTPDSNSIIYKLIDFNDKVLSVHGNGAIELQDLPYAYNFSSDLPDVKMSNANLCMEHKSFKPLKKRAENQRCFALERDLSGYEFLHADSFGLQNYNLPENTHYDLNVQPQEDAIITHTFSSPYYKIGYENWKMKYEDKDDWLPTNLKKKDLKEVGVKEMWNKFNKRSSLDSPVPNGNPPRSPLLKEKIKMPKVIVTRIVKCFPVSPPNVTNDLKKLINAYQKRARDISRKYTKRSRPTDSNQSDLTQRERKRKLKRKKSLLSLNLNRYAHLGIQTPSTDLEIHKAAHFLNLMEILKSHFPQNDFSFDCKQLPKILPRNSSLTSIKEESEDESDYLD